MQRWTPVRHEEMKKTLETSSAGAHLNRIVGTRVNEASGQEEPVREVDVAHDKNVQIMSILKGIADKGAATAHEPLPEQQRTRSAPAE